MKFKSTSEYRYWWPITVKLPSETKSGTWTTESFEMQFSAMSRERGKEIQAEIEALPAEERGARDHDALLEVSHDWRNVIDADKQPVLFSRDLLIELLGSVWHRRGIYEGWARSLSGEDARRGN